jgi:hypothetical protein
MTHYIIIIYEIKSSMQTLREIIHIGKLWHGIDAKG